VPGGLAALYYDFVKSPAAATILTHFFAAGCKRLPAGGPLCILRFLCLEEDAASAIAYGVHLSVSVSPW